MFGSVKKISSSGNRVALAPPTCLYSSSTCAAHSHFWGVTIVGRISARSVTMRNICGKDLERQEAYEEISLAEPEVPSKNAESSAIFYSTLSAIFYCIVSVAMVSVNKLVVSNYNFSYPCFLLLLQSFATVVIVQLLGYTPKFDLKIAYRLIPLSLIYLANVQVGLLAVRLLSVPVYTVIKRLTPFPTMCLDYLLRSKSQPPLAIVGVGLLILGPMMVARGDLDFNFWGYATGLLAVFVQAFFLVAVSWNKDLGFSEIELSWYNGVLTIPPLCLGALAFDTEAINHEAWTHKWFLVSLVCFATLGALLLFSMILLTSRCSGLTLTVVGQVKSLAQVYVGFLWFGEVRLLHEGFLGIALSSFGALLYAFAKYKPGAAT